MTKKRVGVLISGNGSNLQALIDACVNPAFPAEIAVVISNNADAYGLTRAKKAGIPAHVINHKDYISRETFDDAVQQMLRHHLVEIVCLAGFMRILSDWFVSKWHNKMLNIHPSLLPSFKGAHAVRDALDFGVKITGCTVHFVRSEMDHGPIIIQTAIPVLPDDTHETLAARLLIEEHKAYPQALRLLCEGKLNVVNEKLVISAA